MIFLVHYATPDGLIKKEIDAVDRSQAYRLATQQAEPGQVVAHVRAKKKDCEK